MARALAAFLLLALRPASAGVRVDRTVDTATTAGAGALWFASELWLKPAIAPDACRWCDRDAAGNDTLNGFDRGVRSAFRWDEANHGTARLFSNLLAYGGVPVVMAGAGWLVQRDTQLLVDDAILILEAGALAQLVNQSVKFVAGRDRPEVHFGGPVDPHDDHLSFFSGHTNFTFACASAAFTAAALRGKRAWPLAALGGALALATGYFRIAADKHYATDVLTGALVGASVGAGMVYLHRTEGPSASLGVTPSGLVLSASFP